MVTRSTQRSCTFLVYSYLPIYQEEEGEVIVVPWCSDKACDTSVRVSSNPARVTIKNNTIDEEGNGKPPYDLHFPKKLKALSLLSDRLEIEYAMQNY